MEDGRTPKSSGRQGPLVAGGYDVGGAVISNQHGALLSQSDIAGLKCSRCSFILRSPKQVIICGHRYCEVCIEQMTNGGDGPYLCLVNNEKFSKNEIRNDKGCLRDIKALRSTCPSEKPCDWIGLLVDIEEHKLVCKNGSELCSLGCGVTVTREELQTHVEVCPKRVITCQHCNKGAPHDGLQEHYEACEEYPVKCKYCQKEDIVRKQLSAHYEQECDEYHKNCSVVGCSFQGRRSEMLEHATKNHFLQVFEHIFVLESKISLVECENKRLSLELADYQSSFSSLQSEVKHLKSENEEKRVEIISMKSIIEKLEKERESHVGVKDSREFGDLVERDGPGKVAVDVHKDNVTQLPTKFKLEDNPPPDYLAPLMDQSLYGVQLRGQNMKPLNGMIAEPINSLTEMEVSRPGAVVGRIKQNVEMLQSTVQRLSELVQATQENQTRSGIAIDDMRLRQDVLDVKTTNGVLIWKIPDLRRRYRDALDRRTISLYSPPFYTSPHGYRMCIRTYLNGDGIGKGTHVSLFFVLMRSEHDNLLSWPFKQSVRFTLINQKNPGASISEAFIPDLKSPSFHKPENDMNIASGFPKFARQSVLNDDNFVQGNTIFIKCQVDLAGITSQ